MIGLASCKTETIEPVEPYSVGYRIESNTFDEVIIECYYPGRLLNQYTVQLPFDTVVEFNAGQIIGMYYNITTDAGHLNMTVEVNGFTHGDVGLTWGEFNTQEEIGYSEVLP